MGKLKQLSLMTLFALLSACGGGGSGTDSSGNIQGSHVSITSSGMYDSNHSQISSLELNGADKEVFLQWNVSAASVANIYTLSLFSGSANNPEQRRLQDFNCSTSGSSGFYSCSSKGEVRCIAGNNALLCTINNQDKQFYFTASTTQLYLKACVFGSIMNDICTTQKVSLQLTLSPNTNTNNPTKTVDTGSNGADSGSTTENSSPHPDKSLNEADLIPPLTPGVDL